EECDTIISAYETEINKQEARREVVEQEQVNEEKRQRELDRAIKAKEEWKTKWSACLKNTWIGEKPTVAVKEIIAVIELLESNLSKEKEFSQRINGMIADEEAYIAEVKRLAKIVEEDF